jgi:hypothetical protein
MRGPASASAAAGGGAADPDVAARVVVVVGGGRRAAGAGAGASGRPSRPPAWGPRPGSRPRGGFPRAFGDAGGGFVERGGETRATRGGVELRQGERKRGRVRLASGSQGCICV